MSWRAAGRSAATVLLALTAALTAATPGHPDTIPDVSVPEAPVAADPHHHPAPDPHHHPDPDPAVVCAIADKYIAAGHLTEATALYAPTPHRAPLGCSVTGLERIAAQRQEAAEVLADGQRLLKAGELDGAEKQFRAALCLDAGTIAASSGLTEVAATRHKAIPTAVPRWDRFYSDWVRPLSRLLAAAAIAILVLGALSGLFSRWFVRVGATAWPFRHRLAAGSLGVALLLGAGVLLPLYPMFLPFPPSAVLPLPAELTVALIPVGTAVIIGLAARRLARQDESTRSAQVWRDWWGLLVGLALIACAALTVPNTVLQDPYKRLLAVYVALALYGVLLTASAFGQLLRLQVAVQSPDGLTDSTATDYLLARIQTLGTESPHALHASPSSGSLSTLNSVDLSPLPAGKIAGALSGLFFTLRPDLTWRARASLVDSNRVAVTLSRNGRHAQSVIFSRLDLGLPAVDDRTCGDRIRAQLLTGAAAFILLRLSESHFELREGLCGARKWKSITLQVIASSSSLIDDRAQRTALLARAVNEDPGNVLAGLEHLWALQEATPFDSPVFPKLAKAVDALLLAADTGYDALRIRALYRSAGQWINLYAQSGYQEVEYFNKAKARVRELQAACVRKENSPQATELAEQTKPIAEVLERDIRALARFGWLPINRDHAPPPALAYEYACLACLQLDVRHQPARAGEAVQYLRLTTATEEDKANAWRDPCFHSLHKRGDFQELVGTPAPHFLDLPVFAAAREKLATAGLNTPAELARNSSTSSQQKDLAAYLAVSPVPVAQYRRVALLAGVHSDLKDSRLLHLLLAMDIGSRELLRERVRADRNGLVTEVTALAKKHGLDGLPMVLQPDDWLDAAAR